jgi:hypothetical protein
MSKNVKVVCYVDTKDSTKGCLCAIPSDKDARKSDVIQKVADCIVESGILAQFSNHAIDIANAVCHHGFSNINEYEFGVEEVPLIEC